jgi:hypothetical protein
MFLDLYWPTERKERKNMYLKKAVLAVKEETVRDREFGLGSFQRLGAYARLTLTCPVCATVGVFATEPSDINSISEDRGNHHFCELEESFECKHCGVGSRLPAGDRKLALAIFTQAAARKLLKRRTKKVA